MSQENAELVDIAGGVKTEQVVVFGVEFRTAPSEERSFEYRGILKDHELAAKGKNALEHLAELLASGCALNGNQESSLPHPEFRFSYTPPYKTVFHPVRKEGITTDLSQSERRIFERTFLQNYHHYRKQGLSQTPHSWGGHVVV